MADADLAEVRLPSRADLEAVAVEQQDARVVQDDVNRPGFTGELSS
jgi:hypothetical protein